jgi:hypothetical protein
MLNPSIPPVTTLRERFLNARPFKHICIDNFLIPSVAEKLLKEFPAFDRARAKNEMGTTGGKATREDVRALGSGYAEVDELIASPKFLAFLSDLTGIPDLLYDPEYFGGGTHENIYGQELDVHVDFNYHRSSNIHRRLNLIVYLNKDWETNWGGGIEIHSDPRDPDRDEIVTFDPIFNRCVIFETNEYSWHGFSRITLPEHKKHLSRKSFAVYFYSASRPAEEIVPPHNTFYIQRPLPQEIKEGVKLTQEQVDELKGLIRKRDTWIKFYQNLELSMAGELAASKNVVREAFERLRIDCLGYVTQVAPARAYHLDSWIEDGFSVQLLPHQPVYSLDLVLRAPAEMPVGHKIQMAINGQPALKGSLLPGHSVTFSIACDLPANQQFELSIHGDAFCPSKLGINTDGRNLVALLEKVVAHHNRA